MKRLLPRSLGGQMALLLGLALFVAQLINFALILNERQKLTLAQNQGPAITRFAGVAADLARASPDFHAAIVADASHRGARFDRAADSGIAPAERDAALETAVRRALAEAGVSPRTIQATALPARRSAERGRTPPPRRDMQVLRIAIYGVDGGWLTARLITPRRDPWLGARLAVATLLLYLIVLGVTVWIAMRLARPLRELTRAAEAFGGRQAPMPVAPSGPTDLRLAIDAFNAMNLRVLALLDEKDRMLGAIGHDLRTPLAALRIRVESIDDDEDRDAAIAKIAEMTAMLEDILVLARTGRSREEARPIDVAALAEAVVEDFARLGHDVAFAPGAPVIARVQPNLVRRALSNLVDNAICYAGQATVSVVASGDWLEVRVVDHGPGIPAAERALVRQPFYRIEGSRNRETGGGGLGLAIAQSVAESHGGRLELTGTEPHGLTAIITLPLR
ncbi:sensor histidine kinase [Sphingomonas jatrophae]|uniref:histidine kinase n=1 Tax=Sphingomonas jatrophae TaxID=1166337 RepID=A0A1I6MAD7_9SPHN|nr:HAMP domain-containing sensor histidine kinase [Sphingomonas jatrophae]SFS12512.1 Signal transduction histidine kinase [Sphingomonas jatrophae]